MPEITKEEIENIDEKLKYIDLNLKKLPDYIKNSKMENCNLSKDYKDTTSKVYKYIDVNEIQIFITSKDNLESIKEKCKEAVPIEKYIKECNDNFLDMVKNLKISKLQELENEQNKFDISYPYKIAYKNSLKWQVFFVEAEKKYIMLISQNEKENEAMFLLLKKQIQSNKEKVAIKMYLPIVNEGYSKQFLDNKQIADMENYLWFFTKKWPSIYEIVDAYGNRSMHIIGKTLVYENVESLYKIILKNKTEADEKYELLKQLFTISSNFEKKYKFEVKVDDVGNFLINYKKQKIYINTINQFINEQVEENINKTYEIIENTEKSEEKLKIMKQELNNKTEEYNQKQKQIVTFLQCKRSFIGRFKYFFKSNKKHRKINKIGQMIKPELIQTEEISDVYEKKESYTIDDLLAVCNILKREEESNNKVETELKNIIKKVDILKTKIKNADLFIKEIESHKTSIFEFWKFTNKDIPNVLNEANKEEDSQKELNRKVEFKNNFEEFAKEIDNLQFKILSKNERDSIFTAMDYVNIISILSKNDIGDEEEKYISDILENEKEKFIKNKMEQNIIYYDINQKVDMHIKANNNLKNKYEILNLDTNTKLEDFEQKLLTLKKILEKAYNKIKSPYNIEVYSILQNNQMFEWTLANLDLQAEIKKQDINNIDVIKYNIPKGSSLLFYSNHVIYSENSKERFGMDNTKEVLLCLNNFERSLTGKSKEIVSLEKNDYENIIKTIKIYEYDLKPIENKEENK